MTETVTDKRLAVLVSGSGSNMAAIMEAIENGEIRGKICAVISSNHEAYALIRARSKGVDTYECTLADWGSPEARDREIMRILAQKQIDYVLLAGYLGIISPFLVEAYPYRIVNIHPALLPKFGGKGFHGIHVHEAVLAAKERESGATVHFVDNGTDTGLIIAQEKLSVEPGDTPGTLQKRILVQIEHKLFPKVVGWLCDDKIKVENGKVKIL